MGISDFQVKSQDSNAFCVACTQKRGQISNVYILQPFVGVQSAEKFHGMLAIFH